MTPDPTNTGAADDQPLELQVDANALPESEEADTTLAENEVAQDDGAAESVIVSE